MPTYDRLQPLAFRLSPALSSLRGDIYSLTVPQHWKDVFRRMQEERGKRGLDRTSVPSKDLSRVLRALVPDLIAIEPRAWYQGDRPWVYASEPVSPEALFLIVRAWADAAFAHLAPGRIQNELASISASDLQWIRETVDLAHWCEAVNGTAQPESPNTFHLFPELLAARLSAQGVSLAVGEPPLQFRRAPIAPGRTGAELISWPPRSLPGRRGDWLFSVVLLLTVQTVPFQPFPVIHCDWSLRRWINRRVHLPGGKDTSAYLLTCVPWVPGLRHSPSFQVAPMRWRRVPPEQRDGDGRKYRVVWESHLAPIVNWLRHPAPGFPDPDALCADPSQALDPFGDQSVAIVFRNGMTPEHRVQPGLPPVDRRALMEAVSRLFSPELTPVDQPERVDRKRARRSVNPFFSLPTATSEPRKLHQAGVDRRKAIVTCIGPHLALEIRSQSSAVSHALEAAVRDVLGVDSVQFPHVCAETGLAVQFARNALGALGDALPLNGSKGSSRDVLHQAIRERVEIITAGIEPASVPTATLIELSGPEAFDEDEGRGDPKHALRKGFAVTGRVTQFISTNIDESLAHRARSSVLDALRQLGVQPSLPRAASLGLPESLSCVGLWLIKKYRKSSSTQVQRMLPVMVRVDMITGQVQAIAAGMDGWLPYPQVLRAIAQEQVPGIEKEWQARPFIMGLLRQDLLSLGNTVLLCHAQNLRSAWPWLNNQKLSVDHLGVGDDTPTPMCEWPGLRIIRIRNADRNETPEWFAKNGDLVGFPGGLFRVGDRVFFSTQSKPKQLTALSTRVSKLSAWTDRAGNHRPPSPQLHTWNASLLELTVPCLQPEDSGESAGWAYLAHMLRDSAGHYDEQTLLPLPLHLASQMEEYVAPLST